MRKKYWYSRYAYNLHMTTNWLVSQTITYKHDRFLRGHIRTPFSCIVALSVLQSFACLSLTKPFYLRCSKTKPKKYVYFRIMTFSRTFIKLYCIWYQQLLNCEVSKILSVIQFDHESKIHYIVGLIITGKRITTYSNNVNRIYSNINTFIHDIVQKYK